MNDGLSDSAKEFLADPSPENFSPVVAENLAYVRRFVYRIVLCHHDADDIAQETFITAYRRIDSFRGKAKFSTWLCRIARNLALDHLRRRKRHPVSIDHRENPRIATSDSPDIILLSEEKMRELQNALHELPEKFRAAIILVLIDEVPPAEAAKILQCQTATVYWRIHRARNILAEKIGCK